jgi:hypothetical protein
MTRRGSKKVHLRKRSVRALSGPELASARGGTCADDTGDATIPDNAGGPVDRRPTTAGQGETEWCHVLNSVRATVGGWNHNQALRARG